MIRIDTPTLSVAAEADGPDGGWPVILLHGFPYDTGSYAQVMPLLAAEGARVITPSLRGYGSTRFLSGHTPRSGQQAAVGQDVIDLIETLQLEGAILVGYDWGGRAANIAAALRPDLVGGLVALGGYSIQDIAGSAEPDLPVEESKDWYQYYFHSERGRAGLERYRRELTEQLWREWAPVRDFSAAEFESTAASFDNPDFVEVVIHSYRHRFGLVAGDPAYDALEAVLATQPVIDVPTVVLDATGDPMTWVQTREQHAQHYTRLVDHRLIDSGHDYPRHAPHHVVEAVLSLRSA